MEALSHCELLWRSAAGYMRLSVPCKEQVKAQGKRLPACHVRHVGHRTWDIALSTSLRTRRIMACGTKPRLQ